MNQVLRFKFSEADRETVEGDVALAIFAAECVYGRPRVRLETSYLVDDDGGACVLEIGVAGTTSSWRVCWRICSRRRTST